MCRIEQQRKCCLIWPRVISIMVGGEVDDVAFGIGEDQEGLAGG